MTRGSKSITEISFPVMAYEAGINMISATHYAISYFLHASSSYVCVNTLHSCVLGCTRDHSPAPSNHSYYIFLCRISYSSLMRANKPETRSGRWRATRMDHLFHDGHFIRLLQFSFPHIFDCVAQNPISISIYLGIVDEIIYLFVIFPGLLHLHIPLLIYH